MSSDVRETLETDVLIVGAGPAGLSCAIRLADLSVRCGQNKASGSLSASRTVLKPENIFVLEKYKAGRSDIKLSHLLASARSVETVVTNTEGGRSTSKIG